MTRRGAAGPAAEKLRAEALGQYLDEWEARHGLLAVADLARATADLALSNPATNKPAT